jgi:hypothetical protein
LELRETASNIPQQPISVQNLIDDQQVLKLEAQLAQVTALSETQRQTFEAEKQAYKSQLKVLNDKVKVLEKQAIKSIAAHPATTVTKTKTSILSRVQATPLAAKNRLLSSKLNIVARKPIVPVQVKASSPPFTLVSIDHWGNESHAVVRYQGQLHTLMPGNAVLDWTVDGLNETGEGIYVVNSRKQRSLLTLNDTSGH